MASKLDKVRKLKAENMLDMEELENVAGGGQPAYGNAGADSRFLNVLLGGDVIDRWGDNYGQLHKDEVVNAWAKVGVQRIFGSDSFQPSFYVINDKEVTAQEAYAHAMKVTGRYLTPEQWNW